MAAANVAEHLPKFTCAVCLNVLADPCSLSCGHSFDRYCIARSLAVKQECPTCRAPQESKNPPEVRAWFARPAACCVTSGDANFRLGFRVSCQFRQPRAVLFTDLLAQVAVLLRDALALLFPEEIAARGKALEEERSAERVRRAAEAAARAEEARRRAAQPRHEGSGSTMYAMFHLMLPTAGGQVRNAPPFPCASHPRLGWSHAPERALGRLGKVTRSCGAAPRPCTCPRSQH